jgi:hypothetical protein
MIPLGGGSSNIKIANASHCFLILKLSALKRAWLASFKIKKSRERAGFAILLCGERGIRTPGGLTLNGFQDRRNRPLCHLSGGEDSRKSNRQCSLKKIVEITALNAFIPKQQLITN